MQEIKKNIGKIVELDRKNGFGFIQERKPGKRKYFFLIAQVVGLSGAPLDPKKNPIVKIGTVVEFTYVIESGTNRSATHVQPITFEPVRFSFADSWQKRWSRYRSLMAWRIRAKYESAVRFVLGGINNVLLKIQTAIAGRIDIKR